ncbi:MAG TPA: hypothetical protein VE934_16270 [Polaromonas sp.]|uniref:hypothetical protein n=1 Tax=Polaromonas sp. TaxID=1869339 RepID=UPI002D72AA56|nr:hypothetical protein [Polaromonas sp.]HYW58510.1 hypothetical protein [Polaromonas sp.]
MSKLDALIAQSRGRDKSLKTITLRMPENVLSFVDEFSDNFGLTRQDGALLLLETGVEQATKSLENKGVDKPSGFHILNTNKSHGDEDQEMMLQEGIAAAFYDPWKENINRIRKDDWVFLYENRQGIVAFGKGTGEWSDREHHGNKDVCRFQKLKNFTILQKPLRAAEIKEILGRNQIFLKTMSGVPDGQKVLNKVQAMPKVPA